MDASKISLKIFSLLCPWAWDVDASACIAGSTGIWADAGGADTADEGEECC